MDTTLVTVDGATNKGCAMMELGTMPPPGVGSVCRSNCKCGKIYRAVPDVDVALWIGTKQAG